MAHFNPEYLSCPHPLPSACFLSWFAGPRTFSALLTRAKTVSSGAGQSLRQRKALIAGCMSKLMSAMLAGQCNSHILPEPARGNDEKGIPNHPTGSFWAFVGFDLFNLQVQEDYSEMRRKLDKNKLWEAAAELGITLEVCICTGFFIQIEYYFNGLNVERGKYP